MSARPGQPQLAYTSGVMVQEQGDDASQSKGHAPLNQLTPVVLVATEVRVEELTIDRHRDGKHLGHLAKGLDGLEAGVALDVRSLTGGVTDPAYPRLDRRHRHQARAKREDELKGGRQALGPTRERRSV